MMIRLALPLLLSFSIHANAKDWPQYHGANSDKTSPEEIGAWKKGGLKELWKVDTPTGFSSFVVADGQAFTIIRRSLEGIDREICVALDAETGKEAWAATLGLTRYNGGGGDSGARGNKGGDGPRSTPAFDAGKVYVLDSDLGLFCFDAKSGKEVWKHNLVKEFNGRNIKWNNAASPLIHGDHVYVAGGGKGESLLAFDKTSGMIAWKSGDHLMTHATPIVARILGVEQIIFFMQDGLISVEPKTGKQIWNYDFPYKVSTAASPVVSGDIVYCAAGYGVGSGAVKISKDGKGLKADEIWRLEGNKPVTNHWATPLAKDGYLYGMFGFKEYGDGPIMCVEIANGDVIWEQEGFGPGNLVLAGDNLVALSDTGELVLIEANPKEYKELARAKVITGKCWSTPVVADGKIYARSTTEGVCVQVKE
ncbi:MAG: outer membrane protein assembly factor BamB [Pseudoalteromonas tetraodonis]|jgi:outer membrane protein assembly factor BamB